VGAGVGALALAAGWAIAAEAAQVPSWEESVTLGINGASDWLRYPLWPVMQLGNFWMVAALPAGLYAVTRNGRAAAASALATGAAWALAKLVKEQVGRGRPADFFDETVVRESGVTGLGYVSGHAAVAFAGATVVAYFVPGRWKWVPFGLATITGLARIHYGAHFALDVVGGAGLGVACGAIALLVVRPSRGRDETEAKGSTA
jgi:undecaprenyl-diphosphatase